MRETTLGSSADRFYAMKATVAQHWRAEVVRQGGGERDCHVIEPAFHYPGFEYAST